MGIILIAIGLFGLAISLFLLLMALADAYEETQKMKPQKIRIDENCDDFLLSRFEVEKRLWIMRREQKKMGWRR